MRCGAVAFLPPTWKEVRARNQSPQVLRPVTPSGLVFGSALSLFAATLHFVAGLSKSPLISKTKFGVDPRPWQSKAKSQRYGTQTAGYLPLPSTSRTRRQGTAEQPPGTETFTAAQPIHLPHPHSFPPLPQAAQYKSRPSRTRLNFLSPKTFVTVGPTARHPLQGDPAKGNQQQPGRSLRLGARIFSYASAAQRVIWPVVLGPPGSRLTSPSLRSVQDHPGFLGISELRASSAGLSRIAAPSAASSSRARPARSRTSKVPPF
jgi:hypothetical protein